MIEDLILKGVNFLVQKFLLPVLPTDLPFLPIDAYRDFLNSAKNTLIYAFSGLDFLFPIELIIVLVLVILTAEFILLMWKIAVFIINIFRGSGA